MMFGLGKKQKTVEEKNELSESKRKSIAEKAVLRLFDLGFIGKPEYYTNGRLQTDCYSFEIWFPISKKYRLYFNGLVIPYIKDEKLSYRFQLGEYDKTDERWFIRGGSNYIFIEKSILESNIKEGVKKDIDRQIKNLNQKIKQLEEVTQHLSLKVEQE